MKNSVRVTVLITGVGSTTALSVIKGLRKQTKIKLRIIGVDLNNAKEIAGSSFCEKYYKIPPATNPRYISKLLQICKNEKINIIFPIIDKELETISRYLEVFRKYNIFVWLSSNEVIKYCNDKYLTYNFFVKHGIPTPTTWTKKELSKIKKPIFPLVIKPRIGVSSIGVNIAHNQTELNLLLKNTSQALIQKYIKGTEYTVDVLSDKSGKALYAVPRKRVEIRSGISYKGVTVRNSALERISKTIAETLGIVGACNIQFIVTDKGVIKCIEVNPRFSGSLPLTIASGVNGPSILVQMSLGKFIFKPIKYKSGIFMSRYWEEVFYS
jgi:carbamoyl-phosphate synthase large subunit